MKTLLVALVLLAACTPEQQEKAVTTIKSACLVSGALQPVAVSVAAASGGDAAKAAAVDAAVVHPAVVAACAALGGVPAQPQAKTN